MAFPLKRFHQSLFVFQFLIVSHSPPIHANVNGVLGQDHCLQISEWEVATKTTYNTNVWYLSFFTKTLRGHLYKCCVAGHLLNTTHQHLRSFGEKQKRLDSAGILASRILLQPETIAAKVCFAPMLGPNKVAQISQVAMQIMANEIGNRCVCNLERLNMLKLPQEICQMNVCYPYKRNMLP